MVREGAFTMSKSNLTIAVSPKDDSIETLRGIAIILMVASHIVGSTPEGKSFLEYFAYSFRFIRMPLFTVISGFVYAIHPVQPGKAMTFLRGKARRILLPFTSAATLHYVLKALLPGVNNPVPIANLWRIYVFGFDVCWFLQAIFLVFLVVTILDSFKLMEQPGKWLMCLFGASLLFLFCPGVDLFSIWGFFYLIPFFILGCGLNRFSFLLRSSRVVIPVGLICIAGICIQQIAWFLGLDINVQKIGLLSLFVGLSTNIILFRLRRCVPFLARIGFFSYSIYLYHWLGLSIGKRIANRVAAFDAAAGYFFCELTLGIALPILMELIFIRNRILRRIFLGLR